ncbi:metallophosphoesterase [Pseudonocardia sp. RS010]|uniref:metallophosphoesterase n=1 Tax=Pseudonocardia sp. RS010 TaxID=3385979 RepID=UPI0039A31DA8
MKRWLKWAAVGVSGLLVALIGYGALIEPRLILDVDREHAVLPRLGEQWAGTEVALISDLQIGMWFANRAMMERAVGAIVEEEPDIALLGGDFLYGEGDPPGPKVEKVMEILAPLVDSGIPTYAVLGNHDHVAGGAAEMTRALERAGIPVLRNRAVRLPGHADADPLHLVGIGPLRPGLDDVDAALDGVPDDAARIVLMHNPLTFLELPAGSAPLAVAGHTHCGQIALPFTEHVSWLSVTEQEKVVADDWAEEGYGAPGNHLFVTCGQGFSVVPVRINAPPQVVFFELRP